MTYHKFIDVLKEERAAAECLDPTKTLATLEGLAAGDADTPSTAA